MGGLGIDSTGGTSYSFTLSPASSLFISSMASKPFHAGFWDAGDLSALEYDRALSECRERGLAAINATVEDGWHYRGEKEGIKIYNKLSESSNLASVKGTGIIEAPAEVIMILFIDPIYRLLWNGDVVGKCDKIQQVDRLTAITHSIFKAPWPITKRESLTVNRTCSVTDGENQPALFSYATSTEHQDRPQTDSYVRANVVFHALYVKALPSTDDSDSPRCEVSWASCSDPGGAIPKQLINMAQTDQPLCIDRVRKVLQHRPEVVNQIKKQLQESIQNYEKEKQTKNQNSRTESSTESPQSNSSADKQPSANSA